MFGSRSKALIQEYRHKLEPLLQSKLVAEFSPDGTILSASPSFLNLYGYTLAEVHGRPHSMFVDPSTRDSKEYGELWERLGRGEYQIGDYKRVGRDQKPIWLQATYTPILDHAGKPLRIIELSTDVTRDKLEFIYLKRAINAIGSSPQTIVEFNMDETVFAANKRFLEIFGYRLDEIQGRHGSMFFDPGAQTAPEYIALWEKLRAGGYESGEYKWRSKDGSEIWTQATCNPVLGADGKPCKVIVIAADITTRKIQNADFSGQIQAIGKSQAVIAFDLDGTVISANQNFLSAFGYALNEIQGRHHGIFVDPGYRQSAEYREFWAGLSRGNYQVGEYRRVGKDGKEVWLQASYNPILDLKGKPFKIVQFATDVTHQVKAREKSERVRDMMGNVAAGAEQLNSSVQEIVESMLRSKETADLAADRVRVADQATQRLTDAAEAMGGIVDLINTITSQINLLALNATIESARAGEAGRGFAVVANEVKSLASQAKTATQRISREITGARAISGDVVGCLRSIKQSIDSVQEYVSMTASAVAQQSAVVNEMSANMREAAAEARRVGVLADLETASAVH